ncbi:MAG: flagellar biosynthesis protein FlhB [Rhodospirillaceae bacterium]
MSDDQDSSQKTEEPTPKKLEEGRKKGQVANSREVGSFAVLLCGGAAVLLSPYLIQPVYRSSRGLIEQAATLPIDNAAVANVFSDLLMATLITVGPIFALIVVVAAAASLAQSGFLISGQPLKPQLTRISPIAGFKRLFSLKSVVELIKGVFKMTLVGTIAYLLLRPEFDRFGVLLQMEPIELLAEILFLVVRLVGGVLILLSVFAIADYIYQRYEFMKQMRMSVQDIKDEHKQSEGDPQVRAKLRQIRAEKGRQRMMSAVPSADVVVTNPTHFAVAMQYDGDSMAAPVVIAKGGDAVALRIREIANENKIPIVENPPLARALFATVDIDQEVPPQHYKAVAEVISYIMTLKRG